MPKYDRIRVTRFNGKSWDLLRNFNNDSDLSTNFVVSDSNYIAVSYSKLSGNSTSRYRITYSMIETSKFSSTHLQQHMDTFERISIIKYIYKLAYTGDIYQYTHFATRFSISFSAPKLCKTFPHVKISQFTKFTELYEGILCV